MKTKILIAAVMMIFVSSCMKNEPPKTTILCGTSMIASLMRDLAPDADISTLVPPLACPGTFDMKPNDAKKATAAKVFIIHPFQAYLVEKIKKINKNIAVETAAAGALNTPEKYLAALLSMEEVLLKYMPGRQAEFDNRRQLMGLNAQKITAGDTAFRKETAAKKIRVFCSVLQADSAVYAGFEIAGTFGSPDSLTPGKLKEFSEIAKKQHVKYIISNLTGDNDLTADIINKQVKAVKVVLSSFPAEEGDSSWYFNLYNYNMDRIKAAVGEK